MQSLYEEQGHHVIQKGVQLLLLGRPVVAGYKCENHREADANWYDNLI